MLIKVCGMREPDNIREVTALGVDMIGLIFVPQSPRYVRMVNSGTAMRSDYSLEQYCNLAGKEDIFNNVRRVGVFVNEMPQTIISCACNYKLDYIQLHGNESPVLCENLRNTLSPDLRSDIKIIKAFSIAAKDDFLLCEEYEGVVDMFLFDTKTCLHGGSGMQFDWSLLDAYKGSTPFLLSGGIAPYDAMKIKKLHHPKMVGVDLNSRFEVSPAVKDTALLSKFINEIRYE